MVNSSTAGTTHHLEVLAQPLDLRLLGDLHRHGHRLLGHADRLGDLLQLRLLVELQLQEPLRLGRDAQLGQGHLRHSSLPVGTTYVEAIYGGSGTYASSTSNIVAQVVNALGTTSVLTSSPNPSTYGTSVTFTDTVSASTGTPSGTVTFYSCGTSSNCSSKSPSARP